MAHPSWCVVILLIAIAKPCNSAFLYVQLRPQTSPHAAIQELVGWGAATWLGTFDSVSNIQIFYWHQLDGQTLLPTGRFKGIVGISETPILVSHLLTTPPTSMSSIQTPRHDDEDSFSLTFEQCIQSLKGKSAQKTLTDPIQWIHIPKCGTSLGATVYGYLCGTTPTPYVKPNSTPQVNCTYCGEAGKGLNRGLYWDPKLRNMIPFSSKLRKDGTRHRFADLYAPYCDWNQTPHPPFSNHHPLQKESPRRKKTAAITLFRDPRKRLVSAWNNDKHTYGVNRRQEIKELQNISAFIQHKCVPGCQVKMMIGKVCADCRDVTEDMLTQAKQRVSEDLAFVGLTDAFNASVCLFHHMHVGKERSSKFLFGDYKNSKKYKPLPGGGDRVAPDSWLDISPQSDPMDTQLYLFAKELFKTRLKQHQLFV